MASLKIHYSVWFVLVCLFTVSALPGKTDKNLSLACNLDILYSTKRQDFKSFKRSLNYEIPKSVVRTPKFVNHKTVGRAFSNSSFFPKPGTI